MKDFSNAFPRAESIIPQLKVPLDCGIIMVKGRRERSMADENAKRKIYDSVFCDLFQDPKYQLEAYKAIHPEDTDVTVDDIKDVTLEAIFLDGIYNDLGFTVGNVTILLFEEQARWSRNITVRSLMYLGESYNRYLHNTNQDYYGDTPVKLPKPEFYMLYTGDARHTEEELSMADIYWNGDNGTLDLKVKVLYGDDRHSILSQYVQFTQIYKQKSRELGKNREAVLATLKECKERNILKEYIENREAEVIGIMMALYDKDSYMKLFESRKEKEGGIKILASLVKKGLLSLTNAAIEANMTEKDFAKEAGLESQS